MCNSGGRDIGRQAAEGSDPWEWETKEVNPALARANCLEGLQAVVWAGRIQTKPGKVPGTEKIELGVHGVLLKSPAEY